MPCSQDRLEYCCNLAVLAFRVHGEPNYRGERRGGAGYRGERGAGVETVGIRGALLPQLAFPPPSHLFTCWPDINSDKPYCDHFPSCLAYFLGTHHSRRHSNHCMALVAAGWPSGGWPHQCWFHCLVQQLPAAGRHRHRCRCVGGCCSALAITAGEEACSQRWACCPVDSCASFLVGKVLQSCV